MSSAPFILVARGDDPNKPGTPVVPCRSIRRSRAFRQAKTMYGSVLYEYSLERKGYIQARQIARDTVELHREANHTVGKPTEADAKRVTAKLGAPIPASAIFAVVREIANA